MGVPRTICNPVPRTTCTSVTDVVIDNVCNTRSVEECVSVPVQTAVVTPVKEWHQVAPVVVEARAVPAVAVAHGHHGLTKVESTLHGASRHGAGANYEYGDAHSFVSRRTG